MKNKKILIIDDEEPIRNLYTYKFKLGGYEVESAKDGKSGLKSMQIFVPDIVLLDLMMPEMNGDIMLEKLRATSFGKDLKVIVLTNMGEQEIPESVRKLGVNAVILKADMTPRQVTELVKKQLITK